MSFRTKTIIGISIVQSILLLVLIASSHIFTRISTENEFINRASTTATLFASTTKDAVLSTDLASLESFVADLMTNSGLAYARVLDTNSLVLAEAGKEHILKRPFTLDSNLNDAVADGIFDTKAAISEAGISYGRVEIGLSTKQVDVQFAAVWRKMSAIGFGILLLSILLSSLLCSYLLTGIKKLKKASEQITAGNFDYHIDIARNDEIGIAAITFNKMSSNLKQNHDEITRQNKTLEDKNKALQNEIAKRQKAEEQLTRAYDRLEGLVKERTQELQKEIHERKNMEEQLRHSQKMEAIGTLAGGIAHDFNNILCVIIGNTEMALKKLNKQSEAETFIDRSLKATKRAKDLVKQILAFSRKTKPEIKPVQPHILINETLEFIRATIPATIDIQKDIDPDSGTILADQTQFHQILVNLCTNASHAMGKNKGILKIDLSTVELTDEDLLLEKDMSAGSYVKITVSDTGCGMNKVTRERIFDPYFTTKGLGKGSGLGLSVVHGIVKSHGGKIVVESEPGKGTAFHILFPQSAQKAMMEFDNEEISMSGKEHILLIDDEHEIVTIKRKTLEELGYRVTSQTNSSDALDTFRIRPDEFDLVITDQIMPHFTGTELAQEFLKIRPDIRIILYTGYGSEISTDWVKDLGIHEFLLKPVDTNGLAKVIRKTLDCAF